MTAYTAMSAAFERAGLNENRIQLDKALALFRNNGGSEKEAIEAVRAAYELPDEGQAGGVEDGQPRSANVRQPDGEREGHASSASNGPSADVDPSPPINSVRLVPGTKYPDAGPPIRLPTKRQTAAVGRAMALAAKAAVTAFDNYRTQDGRRWGDVGYHEAAGMRRDGDTAGRLMSKVIEVRGEPVGEFYYASFRELLKEAEFVEVMRASRHV